MTANRRTAAQMTLAYDGPALADHSMDAATLGNALVQLAAATVAAREAIDPGSETSLTVDATRPGSFDIILTLTHTWHTVVDALIGDDTTAIANATGIAGAIIGAIGLIRHRARHGTPERTTPAPDGGMTVAWADGTTITATGDALRLMTDPAFVKGVKGITAPVDGAGVTDMTIAGDSETERIDAADAEAIATYDPESMQETAGDVTKIIQVLDLSFRRNGKWRVTDGTMPPCFVAMEDAAFSARMDDGEEFSKGDVLKAVMRVRRGIGRDGVMYERWDAITKVIEHRHAGRQTPLF